VTRPNGLDKDTTDGSGNIIVDNITQVFQSTAANSLATLFSGGTPPYTFAINPATVGTPVIYDTFVDGGGQEHVAPTQVTSGGHPVVYGSVFSAAGETFVFGVDSVTQAPVFELEIF